jgi:hypothetical protein
LKGLRSRVVVVASGVRYERGVCVVFFGERVEESEVVREVGWRK